ncbi:MAG: transcription termination/antitermination protein NusA [Chthoniobacter sp.]|jgi:N utilization substance protein A|nr:transcription termination/antitermination protein NusA [Chthoniobacter sp.]
MNSEILAGLEYFERDKGIKREVLLEAINNAVLSAARKAVGPARDLRVDLDPKSGEMKAYAKLTVVEKVANKHDEISFTLAKKFKADVQLGEELEVPVTPRDFGRIAAQTAKQAMMQRIRQAEKEMIYDEFKDRAGEIVSGTVRRFERSDVIVDLGKFEAIMPNKERVQTEDYNVGDRVRAYVVAVENGARGPEIIISRSHPNFVRRLFETEVSEIADRTVEIKGIAREAGYRTKIAVFSANEKVDPVGACVGMRGARVKNIVRELNNEKVDIIRWSPEVKDFVLEALKPAKIKSVTLDPVKKAILIKVDEDQLSLAIGKRGQNARLTSRLTGWDINIEKDETAAEVFSARVQQAAKALAASLQIDEVAAASLVKGGLASIDTIVDVEPQDIADAIGIDLDRATEIHNAAKRAHEAMASAQ